MLCVILKVYRTQGFSPGPDRANCVLYSLQDSFINATDKDDAELPLYLIGTQSQ